MLPSRPPFSRTIQMICELPTSKHPEGKPQVLGAVTSAKKELQVVEAEDDGDDPREGWRQRHLDQVSETAGLRGVFQSDAIAEDEELTAKTRTVRKTSDLVGVDPQVERDDDGRAGRERASVEDGRSPWPVDFAVGIAVSADELTRRRRPTRRAGAFQFRRRVGRPCAAARRLWRETNSGRPGRLVLRSPSPASRWAASRAPHPRSSRRGAERSSPRSASLTRHSPLRST